MEINWFTVVAQIVNFLVLVWLLKHFLYGRIVSAMDEREEKIRSSIEEADAKKQEAQEEMQEYRKKNAELDDKRETLLSEAQKDAEEKRKELAEKARREVAQLARGWKEALAKERTAFLEDLQRRSARQVFKISRTVLSDLASAEMEKEIINGFIRRLQSIDEKTRDEIAASIRSSNNELLVLSSFEIPEKEREELSKAAKAAIPEKFELKFDLSEELICGIELRTEARKIAWSIAEYLEIQEEEFFGSLGDISGEKEEVKKEEKKEGKKEDEAREKKKEQKKESKDKKDA
jgi:F-type H+-transporting ATPase subunit b